MLEIGCGTGLLTEALLQHEIGGRWLVTDLAPDMVARCRAKLGERGELNFAVLDAEHGPRPDAAPFDVICASLAVQWFAALEPALERLLGWLAPGGHLMVTTLAAGTFAEWRAAHQAEDCLPGTPPFPPAEALAALLPGRQAAPPLVEAERANHADARAFLHSVKAIGAGTPRDDHRPLSPAALRRVMARFEAGGTCATYEVVTCHFRSEA